MCKDWTTKYHCVKYTDLDCIRRCHNVSSGPTIFDRKVELRVVLNSIRCIQVLKKISGRTDI